MAVGRLLSLVRRRVEFTSCQNVYVILLLVLLVLVSSSENILLLRVVYPSQSESELCFGDDALYKTTFYIPIFTTGPGFGPGDIVLERGTQQPPPQFSAHVLWPSGWMDQSAIGRPTDGGRPRHTTHCVRAVFRQMGTQPPSPPAKKRGKAPNFGPCLLWLKGWINRSRCHLVQRYRPPSLRPMFIVAKRSPILATVIAELLYTRSLKNSLPSSIQLWRHWQFGSKSHRGLRPLFCVI